MPGPLRILALLTLTEMVMGSGVDVGRGVEVGRRVGVAVGRGVRVGTRLVAVWVAFKFCRASNVCWP